MIFKIFISSFYPLLKLYWFIVRPETYGVKCVIEYKNKILMIRHTYGHTLWTFPGGGIKRGESPEEAVKREIKEEVGIEAENVRRIGMFESTIEYKKDKVIVFAAQSPNEQYIIDGKEIREARWVSPSNLPTVSEYASKIISIWSK